VTVNPFGDDGPVSAPEPEGKSFASVHDLNGHLVLVTPTKFEKNLRSKFNKEDGSPQFQDRITANIDVLDGPVKGFEDTSFADIFFSQTVLVDQLSQVLKMGEGKQCLGRLQPKNPRKPAGGGNPWMLTTDLTEDDISRYKEYAASKAKKNPFKDEAN
jgi:hypothetical protein